MILQSFGKPLRVFFLILVLVILIYLEILLNQFQLTTAHIFPEMIMSFLQSLGPVIFCFLLYQTFKTVRLHLAYYKKQNFETPRFFQKLGVHFYQKILTQSFLRFANSRIYMQGRKRDYLKTLYEETKQSETSHLFAMFLTFPIQFAQIKNYEMASFISLSVFSIFFNVYPILLQRKNRFLIELKFPNIIG